MDKLLQQQKRAMRIMLNLKYDKTAKNHFINLKILIVYGQYILDCILMAKKESLLDTEVLKIVHPYNTRKELHNSSTT
jgi:hypothetical protein